MITPLAHTPLQAQVTIERLVAMALFSDKGRWWGGEFGSDLHTLIREPLTPLVADRAAAMARAALAPLEKSGVLSVVSVSAEVQTSQLSISVTVSQKGEAITVTYNDVWGYYGS